jgi:hypothetical protein
LKRCPSCNSTYADDSLAFCLTDGAPLVSETPDSYDPATTLVSSTPTHQPYSPQQQWTQPSGRNGMNPKVLIGGMIGLLLLAGIGVGIYLLVKHSKASTPTETWKEFYAAAQKRDGAAMKKLLSKDLLAVAKQDAHDRPIDDYLSSQVGDEISHHATSETRNEKISGETATVEVKEATGDEWNPIPFVKEDGQWKLTR